MNLLKCLLVNNDCYKAAQRIKPRGVMVHSTGCDNPNLRRYVQPVAGQEGYGELIALLGKNTAGNHWNRHIENPKERKCVHAFIGKSADGSVAAVQTLPWDINGCHCGGAANGTHIGFEICEDKLEDFEYFKATYRAAVELTAYLCGLYGLDPLAPGVVIGHGEGYKLGIASSRSVKRDPWFGPFGYSMDGFRQDVKDFMGDEDMLTGEEIFRRLNEYLAGLPAPDWAQEELQEAVDMGITDGTNPMVLMPRYQGWILSKRATQMGQK